MAFADILGDERDEHFELGPLEDQRLLAVEADQLPRAVLVAMLRLFGR